jgi:cyclic pyranopterin phosphate synthase
MSPMLERSAIPIQPLGPKQGREAALTRQASPLPAPASWEASAPLMDTLQRPLRDLRISVTDRCNFRCGYCMPREVYGPGHRFMPHAALLSFEEIERTSRMFLQLGVRKLRLTGGEPLMRKDLDQLVSRLCALRTLDNTPPELALTTNGALLAPRAQALKDAGLQRITISLDALDNTTFQRMSDSTVHVDQVLAGIDAALRAGLGPVKVNMVVQKGVNDDQIVPMARHFRHSGVELRFIEYMDVGHTNGWRMDQVLPSERVQALLQTHFELVPAAPRHASDTARRMAHADGSGVVGFISSVTQAFCGDCNRLRLSTDGRLYTCLFTSQGHDLRAALRGDDSDETLRLRLAALWQTRRDQYSALRSLPDAPLASPDRIEMSYIGG